MITLQTFREGNDHRPVKECVLAIAFFVSAPARVAAQIGVGRSDHDSALFVFRTLKDVSSFVAFDFSGLPQDIGVPGFAESDSLWKRRARNRQRPAPLSWSTLRQSVNTFDVAAAFDTQARDARIGVETFDLLVECHQREDVVDSLFDWEIRVLEGILLRWRRPLRNQHGGDAEQQHQPQMTRMNSDLITLGHF